MTYPLIVLDFEASSLSERSFPIEVGVAVALSAQGPIHVWSSLIQPHRLWQAGGDWDPAAENVHHIPAVNLVQGLAPLNVAMALNRIIGAVGYAYCDGGYYDSMWMERLFKAAGLTPDYALWDMARLFMADRGLFQRFQAQLGEGDPPHRAGADAARLCKALMLADRQGQEVDVRHGPLEGLVEHMAQCRQPEGGDAE